MAIQVPLDLFICSVSLFFICYLYRSHRTNTLPLPPGPKGYPLIGNVFDIPSNAKWETFHEWSKKFNSDIIYLNAGGQSIIILDTFEAATELLEKRSSIYSGRPRLPMLNELMGHDFNFALLPYGDKWRTLRKLAHQIFVPTTAKKFRPHVTKAAHNLLRRFLGGEKDVIAAAQYMGAEMTMAMAYGLEARPENDPIIKNIRTTVEMIEAAAIPGAYLVDTIPLLKYVPEWMPGAGFQKIAKKSKKFIDEMLDLPFNAAKNHIDSTTSFVSYWCSRLGGNENIAQQEYLIKSTAATLCIAGSDATANQVAWGIAALLAHPDVFKRAREEIDSVVRVGELPTFNDEEKLPLVTAICMEILRWKDLVPLGFAHALIEDDGYKGYRLPKGSIVVVNAWAMLHDEAIYPDPFSFKPDRFIKGGKIDKTIRSPVQVMFGFGRRICPARNIAYSALWITVSSLIAAFDLTESVDEKGNVIKVDPANEHLDMVLRKLKHFTCLLTARSKQHEEAIHAAAAQERDGVVKWT